MTATSLISIYFLFTFCVQLNIFSSLSENAYDRPHAESERALYRLVQDHIKEYDIDSVDEHVTSNRFKSLEKEILKNWASNVRSSIFGDEKEEL